MARNLGGTLLKPNRFDANWPKTDDDTEWRLLPPRSLMNSKLHAASLAVAVQTQLLPTVQSQQLVIGFALCPEQSCCPEKTNGMEHLADLQTRSWNREAGYNLHTTIPANDPTHPNNG